jgi:hypothetical protein
MNKKKEFVNRKTLKNNKDFDDITDCADICSSQLVPITKLKKKQAEKKII